MKMKTVTPPPNLSVSLCLPPCVCLLLPLHHCFQVDYMDENEEYFQRQASHRQSRRRFRKINQKGERQTIIDTVDPYPAGKPPVARGYHTVSCTARLTLYIYPRRWVSPGHLAFAPLCSVLVLCAPSLEPVVCFILPQILVENLCSLFPLLVVWT